MAHDDWPGRRLSEDTTRKRPEESRLTVGSPVVLDPHAVRVVIAHIGGDGAAGLDPQALIELGLPSAFVERFVERLVGTGARGLLELSPRASLDQFEN